MGNNNLRQAATVRKDEFFTQLTDIENELEHYTPYFKGKGVLCNCNDPRRSNFFRYFTRNFERLGLRRLVTVSRKVQIDGTHGSDMGRTATCLAYDGKKGRTRPSDAWVTDETPMQGDGDFRSAECIGLLKEADVVVTNPPFSLFREYVAQLMEYGKRFLIIGSQNAITYKDIFRFFKENKMWLGYGFKNNAAYFINKDYEDYAAAPVHKKGMIRVSGVNWFTNLETDKRHKNMELTKTYKGHEESYPKYDNYNAINVDRITDIPKDYDGTMGVPVTFLERYNPGQFELLGNEYTLNIEKGRGYINGRRLYSRIFIRKRK